MIVPVGLLWVTPAVARKMAATALALDNPACAATAAALAAGSVNEAQAAVIGRCVMDLADGGGQTQAVVEAVLLEFAGKVDAHALLPAADHAVRLADP